MVGQALLSTDEYGTPPAAWRDGPGLQVGRRNTEKGSAGHGYTKALGLRRARKRWTKGHSRTQGW